jgi:hypothetical protein
MLRIANMVLLALLEVGLGRSFADAAPPALPVGGLTGQRMPFVIGAPGRLDGEADRREPRLYQRADSAVAAYADIEVVQDRTWLRHEIEHYARRSIDCRDIARAWCRREVRQVGTARVIALASGAQAELVWPSGGNRAVRLGWRRIVETRSGTMTLEVPPAEFANALLTAFPSQLEAFDFDAAHGRAFAADEVDRLLYYVDQVLVGLPAVSGDDARGHAERFVADAVAQIARLRALSLTGPWTGGARSFEAAPPISGVLPPALAEQLEAIHAWRADSSVAPWCAAARASSVAPSLVGAPP